MSYRSNAWHMEKHISQLQALPLYHIAYLGFLNLARHLIVKRPHDIVANCGRFGTPLHAAFRRRHVKVFQLLLSHSVGVVIWDPDSQPLLHLAASDGRPELAQILIERNADINACDKAGWTPLQQTLIGDQTALKDKKLDIAAFTPAWGGRGRIA